MRALIALLALQWGLVYFIIFTDFRQLLQNGVSCAGYSCVVCESNVAIYRAKFEKWRNVSRSDCMWRGFLPLQGHWSSVHYCHMACLSWPPTVRISEVIRNYWQRGSCVGGASVLWRKCPYCVSSACVLFVEHVHSTRSIPGAFSQQHPYSLMAWYVISAVTSVCYTSNVHTCSSLNSSVHCLSAEDRCSCKCWCVETGDSMVLVEDRCSSTNWK